MVPHRAPYTRHQDGLGQARQNNVQARSTLQPLGRDKLGNCYWFQLDAEANLRVWREDLDKEPSTKPGRPASDAGQAQAPGTRQQASGCHGAAPGTAHQTSGRIRPGQTHNNAQARARLQAPSLSDPAATYSPPLSSSHYLPNQILLDQLPRSHPGFWPRFTLRCATRFCSCSCRSCSCGSRSCRQLGKGHGTVKSALRFSCSQSQSLVLILQLLS